MEKDGLVGYGALKPPEEPFLTKAQKFIYDQDRGACLGRTPLSWLKIIIFYLIFYTCLAAFFSLLMLVMWFTLDLRVPKYKMDSSLIGTSPGLGFRPMPEDHLSALITYTGTAEKDYAYWKNTLNDFLETYKKVGSTAGSGANFVECSYDTPTPSGKICGVNIRSWHPCTVENNYDYHIQKPCIFLKLNKIYGWKPDTYGLDELPSEMPKDLKDHIMEVYNASKRNDNHLKNVWVSCYGITPDDVEAVGKVEYQPLHGFPAYFFPYENTEGYLSPLVAIHLPELQRGKVVSIECRAWAKNIVYNRKDRMGMVTFELLIN